MNPQHEPTLSHLDRQGKARMVDVGDKPISSRRAVASGIIQMASETLEKIRAGGFEKGDVLAVARIAAIQGAKETSRLVPLCHPIGIDQIAIDFEEIEESPLFGIRVRAAVRTDARTGVEMEALTAVTVSLLTIYDMCKSVDRQMHFRSVRLEEKTGGTSGSWSREDATETD